VFDEICVIAEGNSQITADQSDRIRQRQFSSRPTYADYFGWISEVSSSFDVSVLANSDIYFDSQVSVFRLWSPGPRKALCLSRWETVSAHPRLNDRNDSQDAWIFAGPVRGVNSNFPVGVPRCDNRIAYELESAGYEVLNPSFSLRAFHLHSGQRDEYSIANRPHFVPPPYKYIWPHNLWPLPRTLAHNARHPECRVLWRLDRRKISQMLKLHWFSKL
jgi:hypothetical protein